MKKIVRLNESDLIRIVKRVLKENEDDFNLRGYNITDPEIMSHQKRNMKPDEPRYDLYDAGYDVPLVSAEEDMMVTAQDQFYLDTNQRPYSVRTAEEILNKPGVIDSVVKHFKKYYGWSREKTIEKFKEQLEYLENQYK